MWITLNLDLSAIFLPLATGAAAAIYGVIALGSLFAAMVAKNPVRSMRVVAWSGGLAAVCLAITALMVLVDLPWPDDDFVHAMLWTWFVLFLGGLGLIVWQARRL